MNVRHALPQRRAAQTFEIQHGKLNTTFQVTLGYYPDGRVGEVFISGSKAGSEIDAVTRDGAVLISLAIQFGVPLDTIRHAITREHDGSPSTIIGAVIERLSHDQKA
jgi:hypothetical protein